MKFTFLQTEHPYTIFQLDITIVIFFLRKGLSCKDIPFIAGMDEMCVVFFHKFFLIAMNNINDLPGVFWCKGFQWIKSFPVI